MTNNLYQDKTKLDKSKSGISTSILDKINAFKKNSKHNLLIDVSGSMDDEVYLSEEVGEDLMTMQTAATRHTFIKKYDILLDLLTKIPAGVSQFAFATNFYKDFSTLPRPHGGTAMHNAFQEMKALGKKEIVLITDGEPDNDDRALHASKGLKIDIIYIGPQPRPEFLEKLANMSGGSFTNINLIQRGAVEQLENKVQLLLGA